jgi:hypothetical protein
MSAGISSSTGNSIHTPLSQVFSWQENETVLIADSVESDGRFVLCTLSSQVLSRRSNILWLCSTAITDQLILGALKKIGCDKMATMSAYLPENGHPTPEMLPRLTIRSIPTLLDHALGHVEDEAFNEEIFVKDLYQKIKVWRLLQDKSDQHSESWVILDDVSALATLVGERLTYGLVLSLQALKVKHPFGLAIRCSNDSDIEAAGLMVVRSSDWFGAGGEAAHNDRSTIPWERTLTELADTVVDVLPLASGYTREAHGRLIFTGRSTETTAVFNYCLTDNQVLAIRIASQTAGR